MSSDYPDSTEETYKFAREDYDRLVARIDKRQEENQDKIRLTKDRISQYERDRQADAALSAGRIKSLENKIKLAEEELGRLVAARQESKSQAPKSVLRKVRSEINDMANSLRLERNGRDREFRRYSRLIDFEAGQISRLQQEIDRNFIIRSKLEVRQTFTPTPTTH